VLLTSELLKLGQSRSACAPEQLQELINLVHRAKNVPGDIVEIGSYKCGSTIVLAAASELYSPEKKIFTFDTFTGLPAVSEFDSDIIGDFGDVNYEEIKTTTKSISSIHIIRGRHENTVLAFPHQPASIVFLDSDLYESHLISLQHFWPDISENGFLILHDYVTLNCPGVRKAFDEFFKGSLQSVIKHTFLSGMLVIQK
jgi:O-methyltransferase